MFNILLEIPKTKIPIHLTIDNKSSEDEMSKLLFGNKSYDWLVRTLGVLENSLRFFKKMPINGRENIQLRYKLKLITILLNILTNSILSRDIENSITLINLFINAHSEGKLEY
jgi:hypothetical protein